LHPHPFHLLLEHVSLPNQSQQSHMIHLVSSKCSCSWCHDEQLLVYPVIINSYTRKRTLYKKSKMCHWMIIILLEVEYKHN
jgi:hypothetical protein